MLTLENIFEHIREKCKKDTHFKWDEVFTRLFFFFFYPGTKFHLGKNV